MIKLMEETEGLYGTWGRLEDVILPRMLVSLAAGTAKQRILISQKRLGEKHGAIRNIVDERRACEGQLAACLMLDLAFNHRVAWNQAKQNGNLLGGISAFTPAPPNRGLIVGLKEPKARRMVLILEEGAHHYRFGGWCHAGDVQRDEFLRENTRNGVTSSFYLVDPGELRPIGEWR